LSRAALQAKAQKRAEDLAATVKELQAIEFEAVDFPQANRLIIHIMAAMAEHEAKMISDRTKAALAAEWSAGTAPGCGY
jgi:DNA invertase Pin-like site-specific DNA recombinase